jgi:peptide/nickel transport system ATP-binding protein
MAPLLEVTDLTTSFFLPGRTVRAVKAVSFSLEQGERLALVGESGCGKTATAASILQLVPPPGRIVSGSIRFADEELVGAAPATLRSLRGNRIAMIFQEPMTALNPVLTIGDQIGEVLVRHRALPRAECRAQTIRLLDQVGIPAADERLRHYPHQLSGGMRQRVVIAMALACEPQLLLADEPTTALDVTIQAQILELIDTLVRERRMALLLITHDLGIVAERTQRMAVMYAGEIVEYGATATLLHHPRHPYTQGLIASLPQFAPPGQPLLTIAGGVPTDTGTAPGCLFLNRCPKCSELCRTRHPQLEEVAPGHLVRCWHHG